MNVRETLAILTSLKHFRVIRQQRENIWRAMYTDHFIKSCTASQIMFHKRPPSIFILTWPCAPYWVRTLTASKICPPQFLCVMLCHHDPYGSIPHTVRFLQTCHPSQFKYIFTMNMFNISWVKTYSCLHQCWYQVSCHQLSWSLSHPGRGISTCAMPISV